MGFNTTVMVYNDALGSIARDPEFGKTLADAILTLREAGGRVAVNKSDAARVIETHHADGTAVVAVGGNHGSVLGYVGGTDHHTDAGKLAALRSLADALGFKLIRKPVKKSKKKAPAKRK